MSVFDIDKPREKTSDRNWALEVLVVVGIVAFGYFAVNMVTQPPAFADRSLDEAATLVE